jgi:hypothetical protein
VIVRKWLASVALTTGFILGGSAVTSAAETKTEKTEYTFGNMRAASLETARDQAATWLKSTGKFDQAAFDKIWTNEDATVLDRVVDTLKIGSTDAAKLMADALNADKTAPKAVPAFFKDEKQPSFLRANLALAYAKHLTGSRVYEEALGTLKQVPAEQVVDPAAYFFNRAVAEHALIQKKEAVKSIIRLLDEVQDAPDRYKMLATIMFVQMQGWTSEEKSLQHIGKLMDNVERRLDLGRGGKETQDIQKKIVFRLDELIKEKENQCKGCCNGGNCPGGGSKPGNGGGAPNAPMQDSHGGSNSGPGKIDEKKLKTMAENWVKMNDKDRAAAMTEITRDLPAKHRVVIEEYFKQLAKSSNNP